MARTDSDHANDTVEWLHGLAYDWYCERAASQKELDELDRRVNNLKHYIISSHYLDARFDDLEKDTASRFWFYGFNPFGGFRLNVLPWLGSDGNNTWCRQTLVIPFFGLGALIIGLRWHLLEECETDQ